MTSQESLPVVSEFPSFHNGDVLVVIHANELYQLHSEVLRRCSPKHFGNLVDPRYAAHLTKAAQNARCFTRYKLVLQPSAIHSNGVFQRQVRDCFRSSIAFIDSIGDWGFDNPKKKS